MRIKRWNVAEVDKAKVSDIVKITGLPTTVCKVISARYAGSTPEEIESFLEKKISFESPSILADMDKATQRIMTAIENGEKIAVYGDYDCDGITSTALLISYFQSIGVEVDYYIPHREHEGYGINNAAIDQLAAVNTNLIITVDNGISSHNEIDYANSLGIDTVVTDHHTPRETLPNAVAVVNPHRKDCPSRFKDYAGVGVAFQLVCALEDAEPEEMLNYYADLVAIGTLADLMPLYGENRAIVTMGIESMREHPRLGIKVILDSANIKQPITSESVAFGVSPRINAAGRVGDVELAVELLLSDDVERAEEIAGMLGEFNLQRRGIEEKVLAEIDQKLKVKPELINERILIVAGRDWHQGVMGIVASRLMDRYGKPTIVFSVSNGIAKGSGRSIEGFSLIAAITHCSPLLTHFGGHTLAAGMTLQEGDLKEFGKRIQQFARENSPIMPVPSYNIDCELDPKDLTMENVQKMDILSPFGAGNPSPIFVLRKLKLTGINPTADEQHMRLKFDFNGTEVNTIYFRMTPSRFAYKEGAELDAVVDIDINEWNGNQQLSVKIKDIRPSNYPEQLAVEASQNYFAFCRGEISGAEEKALLLPSRENLELIYKYLRAENGYSYAPVDLWEALFDKNIDLAKLQIGLDIFSEGGLIEYKNGKYEIMPQKNKVDLTQTKTYLRLNN